ncbi:MAG: GTP-binding protein [Promethearchaeota archaeon]|nr:MAG: GTP-binding protein [Candidatus Lokiarchaeota archaeon]
MEGIDQKDLKLTYKVCVFGDSGVGKTTFVNRYLTDSFHENIKSTLGAAIHIKLLESSNGKVTLQVWDFGGEEKFKFLIKTYAQGSSGGIFMFDLTNYESLINIINWLPEFRKVCRNIPFVIVGSKLDLKEERVCTKEEAIDLMKLNGLYEYLECSSKTGENIEETFKVLLKEILNHKGYNNIKLS